MFHSRKSSKPAPGSAEFASLQLTLGGHSCLHYPKLKPGIQAGVPSRLGFFPSKFNGKSPADAECNRVSVLLTERLCRECYDAVVPHGFDVWCISQHGPCPAVRTAASDMQQSRFPVLVEAGTETFSNYGRKFHVVFNKPSFPAHVDAADAWYWMQKRRRPFYVDALHATSHPDPTLGQRVHTDALVASRHGTIFNAANAHKGGPASSSKSSKWSLSQKFAPSNIRASISSVSLAPSLRRHKPRVVDDSASNISFESRTVRFDEQSQPRPAATSNLQALQGVVPHLHKRPQNQRWHTQPHPSVFLPTSRPRTMLPRSHSDVSWGGFASLDGRLAQIRETPVPPPRASTRPASTDINQMLRSTRTMPERKTPPTANDGSESSSSTSTSVDQTPPLSLKRPVRSSAKTSDGRMQPLTQSLHAGEISDVSLSDSGDSTPSIEPTLVDYPTDNRSAPVIVLHGAKADTHVPGHEIQHQTISALPVEETKDVCLIQTMSIPGAYID